MLSFIYDKQRAKQGTVCFNFKVVFEMVWPTFTLAHNRHLIMIWKKKGREGGKKGGRKGRRKKGRKERRERGK